MIVNHLLLYSKLQTYRIQVLIVSKDVKVALNKNAIVNLHDVLSSSKLQFPELDFELASWHGMTLEDQVSFII